MAAIAGKVKSVTSDVIAIDKNDRVRVLNVDDEVYIGESIKGESQSASVTITAVDGSDISLNGYDTIWLDSSVVSADTSAENSIDTDALFRALLGENYAEILDQMNEKVEDMFAKTQTNEAENSSNSLDSSENLADKHSANDEILSDSNELKVDKSYEHANFDATTIYIEIDNDLNKLS
ncbi:hypothetical protein KO468_06115 [Campylobacter concisus]|uniref:hypothetical protein n=1 Tax=Campylobacter concisus TaxID=199 RepID=UPI001CE48D2B|nr:hypothetical protein [Campylobacter concisus]MCA6130909.1 hypothetical protein [Campylobacter concisus]MCA6132644.1 hypothetical protein [Campylobacter concisus]